MGFDPATLALTAISTALSGIQGYQESKAQAKAYKQQAAYDRAQAQQQAGIQRRELDKLLGQKRARFAARGVSLEGSPLETLADTAAEGKLDELITLNTGEARAARAESQARAARAQGQGQLAQGTLRTGTSLLKGAEKYF